MRISVNWSHDEKTTLDDRVERERENGNTVEKSYEANRHGTDDETFPQYSVKNANFWQSLLKRTKKK